MPVLLAEVELGVDLAGAQAVQQRAGPFFQVGVQARRAARGRSGACGGSGCRRARRRACPRSRPCGRSTASTGVVMKVASVGPGSVSVTLSIRRAPASASSAFVFSWADSHMLRQAITVTTGLPAQQLAAPRGCCRNAVTGCDGARNQTWYGRMTRSKGSSPVRPSSGERRRHRGGPTRGRRRGSSKNGQGYGYGVSRHQRLDVELDGRVGPQRRGDLLRDGAQLAGLGVVDQQHALGGRAGRSGVHGNGLQCVDEGSIVVGQRGPCGPAFGGTGNKR